MRIYLDVKDPKPENRMFVTPRDAPDCSDFLDENGKVKMFTVVFLNGTAQVPDPLGKYMIWKGLAVGIIRRTTNILQLRRSS